MSAGTQPPTCSFPTPALPHESVVIMLTCGFHAPSGTHLTAVFVHHRPPAQRWFLYSIGHPSHGGFRTPSPTHPTVVFTHHWAPISPRFCTPSRTRPTTVFVHHRAPIPRGFHASSAPIPRRFLYTITHPPNGGFRTQSCTHLTAVFVQRHSRRVALFLPHDPATYTAFLPSPLSQESTQVFRQILRAGL